MTEYQELLIHWITERWNIRKLKEAGKPKPWSSDPTMQSVRYCNVNREDDTVSRWIRSNWRYPKSTDVFGDTIDTCSSFTFAMVVSRLFNLSETLDELHQPIDDHIDLWIENAEEVLYDRMNAGKRVWNAAYIISTNGKKMPKIDYCIYLLRELAKRADLLDNCTTLQEAHTELMSLEGIGSFLAAQVVADLKNTEGHPLASAPDWFTFSAPGPGSLRGLSWFWQEKITPRKYQGSINKAYELIQFELPDEILDILCHQNLQNCFCEYDKYIRVRTGSGRAKQKYEGV